MSITSSYTLSVLNSMDKLPVKKFVKLLRHHCHEHNVDIKFRRGKRINDEGRCHGYFSEPCRRPKKGKKQGYYQRGEIVVAKGCDEQEWVHTLVHEYSHFLQWLNRRRFWSCSTEKILERSAERTAVRILKKNHVMIDIKKIIVASNDYLKKYYGY